MKEVGVDQLIWPAAWRRLRRLSRSPCRWGRCWWTLPDCRRYSGTSRPPSSLWGYQSLCISWPPPGEEWSDIRNLQKFSLENPQKTDSEYPVISFIYSHFHTAMAERGSSFWGVSKAEKQLQTYLDYMQLGQQVAVCQRHFVPIQEAALRDFDVLDAVVVNLIGQRWTEIVVQFLQRLQESTLKRWKNNGNSNNTF